MDASTTAAMKALLPHLTLGLIFTMFGLTALLGSLFTWRQREFSLLYFGLFGSIYGLRILIRSVPIDLIFGWHWSWLAYVDAGLGYALLPILALFLEQILGPGWKNSIRWSWRVTAAFTVLAISYDLITGEPMASKFARVVMLALGMILIFAHSLSPSFRATKEQRGVLLVLLLGTVMIVNAGAVAQNWVPWDFKTEYPGLLCALGLISYLVINRVFNNRAHMVAIREELDLARRVQQSILPDSVPRIQGLDLAVRYHPMTAVAGDYYDFHQITASQLGVLVADVSGHGIPAALIASMAKVAFAAKRELLPDPGALLEGMNDSFEGNMEGKYLTATCFVVDRSAKTLTFAGAAHPPLMHWQEKSQTVQQLASTGMMVGLFPSTNVKSATVPFEVGDRVIAYSDGITEAANNKDEMFDEDHLQKFLSDNHALSADDFADLLMKTVAEWRGAETIEDAFDDDLTLVVLDMTTPVS